MSRLNDPMQTKRLTGVHQLGPKTGRLSFELGSSEKHGKSRQCEVQTLASKTDSLGVRGSGYRVESLGVKVKGLGV